jgi:hypothetical protein
MPSYSYSLQNDFPNQAVDLTVLTVEIENSSIAAVLAGINLIGDTVEIFFDVALSPTDEATLDGIVANHQGIPFNNGPQRVNVIAAQDNATNVPQTAATLAADPIGTEQYQLAFYCELRVQNNTNNGQARFEILVDGQEVASGGVEGVGFFDARSGALVINTSRGASPLVELRFFRAGQNDTAQVRRIRLSLVPLFGDE